MPKSPRSPSTTLPGQDPTPDLVGEPPGFDPSPPPGTMSDPTPDPAPLQDQDPSSSAKPSPSSTTPTTGSSPGSSADKKPAPELELVGRAKEASTAQLADILGSAFELAGVAIHDRLTPGDNDCWVPRAGEREMVSGALASIAVRHMPTGMGAASDLSDAITAAVGVALYGFSNALRTPQVRRNIHPPVTIHNEDGSVDGWPAGGEPEG